MTARPVPVRRPARLLGVGAVLLLTGLLAVWLPTTATAQDIQPAPEVTQLPEGMVMTEWGPLTQADRNFLIRVRYANLWEEPAGRMAAEQGSTEYIREIGETIRQQHIELDQATLDAAAQLGVELPNEAHASNQLQLDDMAAAEGVEFDRRFVQHLREAHGVVYPIIAYARISSQNELVREFASVGERIVQGHLTFLEGSGLVEWDKIPPAPEPLGSQARYPAIDPTGVPPMLVWGLLLAGAITGGIQTVRVLRPQ